MDFDGVDLREYERMTDPYIPETLKSLIIDNGLGEKVPAETTDLSSKGIRILIPSSTEGFEKGNSIIITPRDNSFTLIGKIIHTICVSPDTTYIGLRLSKTSSLPKLEEMLESPEQI